MINIREKVDFTGEDIYVGMDVHLKSWSISLYHNGLFLKSFQQPADVEVLVSHLQCHYPRANYHCAYEAGFCGFWIQRSLQEKGVNCPVANPADIPQTDKGYRSKTDRNDAKRIGRALQAGQLNGIYVPDRLIDSHRRLLRHREHLQNDIRRNKTRVKSLLHQTGIAIPRQFSGAGWSSSFNKWLEVQQEGYPSLQAALQSKASLIRLHREELLSVTRKIRELLKTAPYRARTERLMTVPGIGILTAGTLLLEIVDLSRFSNFKQFNSFIGFCPDEFSSGENDRRGGITVRRHNRLRSLTVEAGWIAIRQDPALGLAFKRLCQRMTAKRAITRIARRLLNRIWRVWTKEQNYEIGIAR